MEENRLVVRMSSQEKQLLKHKADFYGYSISDYAKLKLFHENTDFITKEDRYISPDKDRHNFISVAVLHDIYWMMFNFISENKNEETIKEIKNSFRQAAKKSIAQYGYLKVAKDE